MSQRGRSGFLSYLLLLSRLLQFEHRAEEVAPTSGPRDSQGQRGEGEAGRPETWGMGVSRLHPRPACPLAQLEQLARRAQRACGHRALPARRTEQPVDAATGCAVSGRGRVARGGVGLSVGGTRVPCWVGP